MCTMIKFFDQASYKGMQAKHYPNIWPMRCNADQIMDCIWLCSLSTNNRIIFNTNFATTTSRTIDKEKEDR